MSEGMGRWVCVRRSAGMGEMGVCVEDECRDGEMGVCVDDE